MNLYDVLVTEIFTHAKEAHRKSRLRSPRNGDAAAILLRDVGGQGKNPLFGQIDLSDIKSTRVSVDNRITSRLGEAQGGISRVLSRIWNRHIRCMTISPIGLRSTVHSAEMRFRPNEQLFVNAAVKAFSVYREIFATLCRMGLPWPLAGRRLARFWLIV